MQVQICVCTVCYLDPLLYGKPHCSNFWMIRVIFFKVSEFSKFYSNLVGMRSNLLFAVLEPGTEFHQRCDTIFFCDYCGVVIDESFS